MYKENEEIILLKDLGKEDEEGFLPEGTILTFVDAKDFGFKSYIIAKYEDRLLTLPELAVKPAETNSLAVLKDFNNKLIENSPELRKYHHNPFMRLIYAIKDFFTKLLTKKKEPVKVETDLSDLKNILNDGGDVE